MARPAAAAWGSQFNPPPSSQLSIATQPPPPTKAKSRRKRHVPPGPAGVWYQAMALQQNDVSLEETPNKTDSTNDQAATDVTTCPAWMLMQLQLPLLTPYLPPYATIAQRHAALRTILPNEYILIPDLMSELVVTKQLIVLVHAVHSHSSCDWTVELQDETGSSINAWIAPHLVRQESEYPDKVRAGTVWCLQDVAVLPGSETKPWLLIHEANIIKYWVAPKEVPNDVYLQWMAKRTELPNSFAVPAPPDEREKEVDEEQLLDVEAGPPVRSVTMPPMNEIRMTQSDSGDEVLPAGFGLPTVYEQIPLQGASQAACNTQEETLPADFGQQVLSSLHPPSQRLTQTTAAAPVRPASTDQSETGVADFRRFSSPPQHTQSTVVPTPTPPTGDSTRIGTTPPSATTTRSGIPSISQKVANPYLRTKQARPLQQQEQVASRVQVSQPKHANPYGRQQKENIEPAAGGSHGQAGQEVPHIRKRSSVSSGESQVHEVPAPQTNRTNRDFAVSQIEQSEDSVEPTEPHRNKVSEEQLHAVPKSSTVAPNSKRQKKSNPLDSLKQFAATSPKKVEQQQQVVKKSRKARKTNEKPRGVKSPTNDASSALWSASSAAMMGMFDEDEDEIDVPSSKTSVMGVGGDEDDKTPRSSDLHSETNPAQEKQTLFEVSNFAGMDMMGMFDD